MKILSVIVGAFIFLSCANSTQIKPAEITSQQDTSKSATIGQTSDNSKWTDNFLELQKAITTGDKKAVKSFMIFLLKIKEMK